MIVYSYSEILEPKEIFESLERRREKFSEVLIYYTEVEKKNVDCYLWHCFKQEGRDVVGSLTMDLPEMVDVTYG